MIKLVYTNGKPDNVLRECRDCNWCRKVWRSDGNWWCTNDDANKEFGTNLPGRVGCPFWAPIGAYASLSAWEKMFGEYMKIDLAKVRCEE